MSRGIPPVAMMSPGAESLDRMGILLSWMLNSWLQRWARWREQPLLSCRANRGQREGVTLSGRFRNSPFWCRRPRIELAAVGVSFSAKQCETSPELVWANLHKHFFIFINVKNTGSEKEFFKQIMPAAGMSKRILFFSCISATVYSKPHCRIVPFHPFTIHSLEKLNWIAVGWEKKCKKFTTRREQSGNGSLWSNEREPAKPPRISKGIIVTVGVLSFWATEIDSHWIIHGVNNICSNNFRIFWLVENLMTLEQPVRSFFFVPNEEKKKNNYLLMFRHLDATEHFEMPCFGFEGEYVFILYLFLGKFFEHYRINVFSPNFWQREKRRFLSSKILTEQHLLPVVSHFSHNCDPPSVSILSPARRSVGLFWS